MTWLAYFVLFFDLFWVKILVNFLGFLWGAVTNEKLPYSRVLRFVEWGAGVFFVLWHKSPPTQFVGACFTGSVSVDGTVDGRDVAADARLDALRVAVITHQNGSFSFVTAPHKKSKNFDQIFDPKKVKKQYKIS